MLVCWQNDSQYKITLVYDSVLCDTYADWWSVACPTHVYMQAS